MKNTFIVFFSIALLCGYQAFGQYTISGSVLDMDTQEPLVGAAAVLKGTTTGSSTGVDGSFKIEGVPSGKYTVVISFVGYESIGKEVTVANENIDLGSISLYEAAFMFDQVVISGARQAEKITETPATIEVINSKALEELPSFNPGELLSRVKGVDFIRSGVVGTGINIRGFNSNFNAKNLQVNDGRFATLIATGLPLGPLTTQIKEDIERVEVILGPNAALYGPNAHNGLVHTITKDPRSSEGTTVALGMGNQGVLSTRARHAQVINDRLAFKVTGEYTQAEEFEYMDSVYINRDDVPGNEGYEEYLLDNDIEFFRGEAALYYSLTPSSDLVFGWGGSNGTYLAPTNVGRNQIKDWRVNYFHLRYTSDNFFAQVYQTSSKTDDTYAIDQRTKNYYAAIDAGSTEDEARASSLGNGATFADDSKRWNAEMQYNKEFGKAKIVVGAQWQRDAANSNGTYLLDNNGDDPIIINQFGAYGQVDYRFNDDLKAVVAFRGDNHEVYDFNFVPKAGLVYNKWNGALRLTYGQGIAAPTILNMYSNLFNGLILGNAEGFTLADGTTVAPQTVEKIRTTEIGYKGEVIKKKLFLDVNAYYNISEDFLSPATNIGVATLRGDTPIEQVQGDLGALSGVVVTYVNFGEVDTYGFDIGANYYFNDKFNWTFNYSYFDYSVDENDLENNDFNGDGVVNALDILVNAPQHKFGTGINYSGDKFFGNVFVRWVQAYDYFSSFQIAAETQDLVYRGVPVVADARSNDTWNYGQLGGFTNVDIGLGYRINDRITASGQVTNLFDTSFREFTASPFIGRLFSVELKVNLPGIKKKS